MTEPALRDPSFDRFSGSALAAYYRRQLASSLAINLAYRGAVAIWVLTSVIQPLVFIVVWRTVAGSGSTGRVRARAASSAMTSRADSGRAARRP